MPRDPEKAKARKRRYLEREKIKKYGPDAAGRDMRGRHGNHARSAASGRWNDDRIVSSHGYTKIRVGAEHPLADSNGYAYEHLLVWVSAGRTPPGDGELLHHDNENKQDNRLRNLLLKSTSSHAAEHIALRRRGADGRLLPKEMQCQ